MTDRRTFLARTAGALGTLALAPASLAAPDEVAQLSGHISRSLARQGPEAAPALLAGDEAFWVEVRQAFDLHPGILNLDNGWTNPTPRAAMARLVQHAHDLEALPADRLANIWPEITNTTVRAAVAAVLGVPGNQMAFVRNATEALDTVLLGLPLQRGDEVVCSAHDYYSMLNALEQRQARDGIVLKMLRPPVPAPSLDALAELYEAAIGPKTRLVLLTHPSNLTGQLLPVWRITEAAHRVGAEVVVDGAQSLGLLEGPVSDLGCDYYGASLHKWLGAPVGMGVLWMKPEHTAKVWPLVPSPPHEKGMGRFEWIGTSPEYVGPAMLPALALHSSVGPARKAARLRYLTDYLRAQLAERVPTARFYSLPGEGMTCGLCTFELPGFDSTTLKDRLLRDHQILVQAMVGSTRTPEIKGIRVSPNVYTTPAELDRLVAALVAVTR